MKLLAQAHTAGLTSQYKAEILPIFSRITQKSESHGGRKSVKSSCQIFYGESSALKL